MLPPDHHIIFLIPFDLLFEFKRLFTYPPIYTAVDDIVYALFQHNIIVRYSLVFLVNNIILNIKYELISSFIASTSVHKTYQVIRYDFKYFKTIYKTSKLITDPYIPKNLI